MAFRKKKFELSPRLKLGVGRGYSQNQILKFSAILCLVLAIGLAFNAFRLIAGSRNQTGADAAPQVLGASDVRQTTGSDNLQFTNYVVVKGDTLFNISQKFNIDWATLAALNNLQAPFSLKPGQSLKVPKQ